MTVSNAVESVSEVDAITRHACEQFTQSLVAAACRLVGSGNDVRSVRVLTPRRPTYDELVCFQERARDHHVRLTVGGNCVVTVQPECEAQRMISDKDVPT
jgi:hypothetical protein